MIDKLHSYPAAKAEIPTLTHFKHVFVKASAWINNRAENSLRSSWIGFSFNFTIFHFLTVRLGVALLLLGLGIFSGAISSAKAQLAPSVLLDNSRDTFDLWSHISILSDPDHTFTIADVLAKRKQFEAIRRPYANLGPHKDTVWLRTDVALSNDAPVNWWLSVDMVLLDEIDLYVVEEGQVTQNLSVPVQPVLARRSFAFGRPVFQLALQPGRHYELMVRVRKFAPYAVLIPVSLDRPDSFIKRDSSTLFWRSLVLGISSGFLIYALFVAALKRDPLCLWFSLFAACSSLWTSLYYGLQNEYLWLNLSVVHIDSIVSVCFLIRTISCFLFVDGVLDLREQSPLLSRLLKALAAFFALLTVLLVTHLVAGRLISLAFSIVGTSPLFLLVPFVVRRVRDRDPLWNWAIAGAMCYSIGMTVSTVLHYGHLPWNRWTDSAEHAGAFLNEAAWVVVMSIRTNRRQRAAELTAERERQAVAKLAIDLKNQKEIAEEASLTKSRFLAAASHDLRQPVHALSLFIGALRNVPMNAEGQRVVDQIEASADAMDRLFAALLDISKLDAGIVEILRRPFAIDAVLIRVCDDYAGEAAAKGLVLSYVRCRATVNSDPTLVERIARNLISNAVRYTDTGRIVVGCRHRGSSVVMQVWDTGRGIPPDQQEQVFHEYYQVDNPERDREKGLGLGLAIVQRVANLLECDLRLCSEHMRGSCFEISLPRASEAATLLSEPVDGIGPMLSTGLVVFIDDEKAIRAGMSALLTNWGYEVLAAGSADDAIQLLASYTAKPDLLICDLRLRHGENGIEAIEKIRTEYNASIPAMLITGDTAASRLHEAHTSELLVLHKPVPNSKLRATMARLIATKSIQQESDTEV